jgi:hypothetical protein
MSMYICACMSERDLFVPSYVGYFRTTKVGSLPWIRWSKET